MKTTTRYEADSSGIGRANLRSRKGTFGQRKTDRVLSAPESEELPGLSTDIVELIAGAEPAASSWWKRFWRPVLAVQTHWLARRRTLLVAGKAIRVADLAYVYVHGPLERGQHAEPECGNPRCVRHLRLVGAAS